MKIQEAKISSYHFLLIEPGRSPSKGGNTKALHSHMMVIDGERYSFLALGAQQWVWKEDLVSFEYKVINGKRNKKYNNVDKNTIVTTDRTGNEVVRGNRGFKKMLRTVEQRTPCSRREWNS